MNKCPQRPPGNSQEPISPNIPDQTSTKLPLMTRRRRSTRYSDSNVPLSRGIMQSVPLVNLNQLSVKLDTLVQYETFMRSQMMESVSNAGTIVEDFERYIATHQRLDQGTQRKALEVSMADDGVRRDQMWQFLSDGCVIRSPEDFAHFMEAAQGKDLAAWRDKTMASDDADWGEELGELDDIEEDPLCDTLPELPKQAPGATPTVAATLTALLWKLSAIMAAATRLLGKARGSQAAHYPASAWVSYSLKHGKLVREFMDSCSADVETIQAELEYRNAEAQELKQELEAAESNAGELQEALQHEKEKLAAILAVPFRKPVSEKGIQVDIEPEEPPKEPPTLPQKALEVLVALRHRCAIWEAEARWLSQQTEEVPAVLQSFMEAQHQRVEAGWRAMEEQTAALQSAFEEFLCPACASPPPPGPSGFGGVPPKQMLDMAVDCVTDEAVHEAITSLKSEYLLLQGIAESPPAEHQSSMLSTARSDCSSHAAPAPPPAGDETAPADSAQGSAAEEQMDFEDANDEDENDDDDDALEAEPTVEEAHISDGDASSTSNESASLEGASPDGTPAHQPAHGNAKRSNTKRSDGDTLRKRRGRHPLVRLRRTVPSAAAGEHHIAADECWDDAEETATFQTDLRRGHSLRRETEADALDLPSVLSPCHHSGGSIPQVATREHDADGALLETLRRVDATLQKYCGLLPKATDSVGATAGLPMLGADPGMLVGVVEGLVAAASPDDATVLGSLASTLKTLVETVAGLATSPRHSRDTNSRLYPARHPDRADALDGREPVHRYFAAQKEATRHKWDMLHRRQTAATRRRVQAICLQRDAPGPNDLFWGPRGLPLVPIIDAYPQGSIREGTWPPAQENTESTQHLSPTEMTHDRRTPTRTSVAGSDVGRRPGVLCNHPQRAVGVVLRPNSGAGRLGSDSELLGPWRDLDGPLRPSSAPGMAAGAGAVPGGSAMARKLRHATRRGILGSG
eukprot:GGOE01001795.1.p1 GENE.GGOE01001795.1~~GGOE01001795.1.p1  ORF type:complete len:974 (-),score=191.80 GGOE01001795.1:520-3441(-)